METSGYGSPLTAEAERAFAEEDYARAAELFDAASGGPAGAEAAFYGAVSAALQDGAAYGSIAQVGEKAGPAVQSAAKRLGTGTEYYAACSRLLAAVIDVTARHDEAVAAYCKKERKKFRRSADALSAAESLRRDCALTIGDAAKKAAGAALEHAEDLSAADEFFWNCVQTLLDNADACRVAAELGRDPEIAELFDVIGQLRGNVFGEGNGEEEIFADGGEYTETVCPFCGETLSFSAEERGRQQAECPFCGGIIPLSDE